MKKKSNLLKISILLITLILLTGCGRRAWMASKDKEDRQNMIFAAETIARTLDAHNVDEFYGLFGEEYQTDELYHRIDSFFEDLGEVNEVYIDMINHSSGRKSKSQSITYGGIFMWVFTNDDIYTLHLNFILNKENDIDITCLRVISAKTEVMKNIKWWEEHPMPVDIGFEYLNNYDSEFSGEYKFIGGHVLQWDSTAPSILAEEIKEEEWKGININEFIKKYGNPAANYRVGKNTLYHFFYNTKDGKYLEVYVDDEGDIIHSIRVVEQMERGIEKISF